MHPGQVRLNILHVHSAYVSSTADSSTLHEAFIMFIVLCLAPYLLFDGHAAFESTCLLLITLGYFLLHATFKMQANHAESKLVLP